MKKILTILTLLYLTISAGAQTPSIKRIEPNNWWVGMKNPNLELLIYGVKIGDYKVSITYPGVRIEQVEQVENPNYLFVDVVIDTSAKPGDVPIMLTNGKSVLKQNYKLLPLSRDPGSVRGFSDADLIYMIMPDRFSNGDTSNDVVAGMKENKVDRKNPSGRHGGDLQGIINHLDYISDLGATAIWLNPAWENDQPSTSYHGYACTDLYKIDARYGGNSKYLEFVNEAHRRGFKVIQDYIYNHVGSENWFVKDLPQKDWLNQHDKFTRCNYIPAALIDPYGSDYDRNLMTTGWFSENMPDLNQKNPLLARYLTQNTIWWVEFFGVDGFRIDTYPYPDNTFMNNMLREVKDEYPNIKFVGETWEQTVSNVAFWQEGSVVRKDGVKNELPCITDFTMNFAMKDGLKEDFGWKEGWRKIYYNLTQDVLFGNPYNNMIFLDNHDMNRIYSELDEDFDKWKQGMTLLFTMRGIPQLYYGTEILMSGKTKVSDGFVRKDFPGGWAHDSLNKFTAKGRTDKENEAFDFVRSLANYRRNKPVLQDGRLMQFVPNDDVYVYFRYDDLHCVMVVLNSGKETKKLDTSKYAERMNGYKSGMDIVSGIQVKDLTSISIPPKSSMIIELHR